MYLDEYKRWLAADLEDADLKPELSKIEGNDEEIKDRFAGYSNPEFLIAVLTLSPASFTSKKT